MEVLACKFLQRVPIVQCHFKELILSENIDELSQELLLDALITVAETNPYYSSCALKQILNILESLESVEINEAYYDYLMEWLPSKPLNATDSEIISYPLGSKTTTKIKESPNLISGLGTTGLRTWEASVYLTDYFLNKMPVELYENCFKGKNILELGCGTGLVGISLLKHCKNDIKRMVLTDGDTQLIDKISTNLLLNEMAIDDEKLEVCKLWWGEDQFPQYPNDPIQTLVAADVTYDASAIPALVETIKEAMFKCSVSDLFLGATVRSTETLAVFENALEENRQLWNWSIVSKRASGLSDPLETPYYRPQTSDILVYHVTVT
ncbi:protein-lysine N-methyltransferase [Martiniozyma asiatica (nom. inval.)]|nr:protein-lysine N-methyltransferase [Martiniozyma asiatica]